MANMHTNHRPNDTAEDKFWAWFYLETRKLARRYPNLHAFQKVYQGKTFEETKGAWEIEGPFQGVWLFKQLARQAAAHLGYRGGEEGAVQFFLDHMNGDHIVRKTSEQRRDDEREAKVRLSDGSLEVFRGRQRQA